MRFTISLALLLSLGGCGGGLEGTYSGEDSETGERTGFLDYVTLKSGNRLEAGFLGQTKTGTYTVDGKRVTLTVDGDSSPEVLMIKDDGCLEGNAILGRYCRDGKKTAAVREEKKEAESLVGTYEARHAASDQGIRLEFKRDQKVTVNYIGAGAPPAETATYAVVGNEVHIAAPGAPVGAPPAMLLTRDGDALIMTDGAESARFEKQ
jgi:hypothetical protein